MTPPLTLWPSSRIILLIVLLLAANYTAQILVYGLTGDLFLPVLAGATLGVLLPCQLLARRAGSTLRREFELGGIAPGVVVASVVTAAAGLLPTSYLASLSARIHPADPEWLTFTQEHLPTSSWHVAIAAATVVLAAPLAEEIIFRGLLHRVARRAWGPVPAAVVSALLFGLVHGEPWYLFGLVALGLILAFLYEATGTLIAPVIVHAIHNAVSFAVMTSDPAALGESAPLTRTDWMLLGASLLALALTAAWLVRRRR